MLLRASGKRAGEVYDLRAVMGEDASGGGVREGAALLAFAEAVAGRSNDAALEAARGCALDALGPAGLVDAAAVLANFAGINRVASATGVPIDRVVEKNTRDIRAALGIDAFREGR